MDQEHKDLVDAKQPSGRLAPVFKPSFTAYHVAAPFDPCILRDGESNKATSSDWCKACGVYHK